MKNLEFRKYPAFFTAVGLAIGILISYGFDFGISGFPNYYFILTLSIISVICIFVYRKVKLLLSVPCLVYSLLVILFGFISMQFKYYKIDEDSIYRNIDSMNNKSTIIYGTVSDDPDLKDDRFRLTIDVDSLVQNDSTLSYNGTILATIYKNKFSKDTSCKVNFDDYVELTGNIEKLPHRRNPGEFNYGEYLKLHDFEANSTSFGYDKVKDKGVIEGDFFNKSIIHPVKDFINNSCDKFSEGDEKEFLKGLLLGEKANISQETRQNFVNAGVAHIIAVSGLNVAYVIIVLYGILLIFPLSRTSKNLIIIPCLIMYSYMTGNSASIVRATVMAITILLAQFFERRTNSYNVIAFSAVVLFIVDPRQVLDPGFLLSYSAILAIVYFNPRLDAIVSKWKWYSGLDERKWHNKYFKEAVSLVVVSLAAQIGTMPVTSIMFKKVSVVSMIANLVAIPVSNTNMAIGFATVIFSSFSTWLADVFASANNFLMHYLLKFVAISANFDFSFVETYRVDLLWFLSYYVFVFLLFSIKPYNFKPRIALLILLAGNFFLFRSVLRETNFAKLTYMDVGNSNCTLISMPEGTNIMINAGTSSKNYSSAERNVIPYLKAEGVSEINLLIITSIDENEFINLRYFLNHFQVNKVMIPAYYQNLFTKTGVRNKFNISRFEFVDSSKIINSKGKFRIYLYYDIGLKGESMMAQFAYGTENFLFADAEEPAEISLNSSYIAAEPYTNVLRVSSYGSFDLTQPGFIVNSNPENIVISTQNNKRKLPEKEAFTGTLTLAGIHVNNTAERGAVIFRTDGVKTELLEWN